MTMSSAIVSIKDPEDGLRSRGHGGLGAVMASKKVKFITIKPIAKPDKFKEANRTFAKALVDHPVSQVLGMYGTNVLVNIINESVRLLTRNFSQWLFKRHEAISGDGHTRYH
jgi:aldehyde:ferredoxin oxidoreductase